MNIIKGVGVGFIGIVVIILALNFISGRPLFPPDEHDMAIALVKKAPALDKGYQATVEQILTSSVDIARSTGSDISDVAWVCLDDGPNTYMVVFKYIENGSRRMATWRVDLRTNSIDPVDDISRQIMDR